MLQVLPSPCRGWRLDQWAWSLLVIVPDMLLWDVTLSWLCNKLRLWTRFQTMLLPLLSNSVCNNLSEHRCMNASASYLWNVVTGDVLCWIMYDLGLSLVGLKSFMILVDYRSYMGSARIWSLPWMFLYLCSYNLDGSITLCLKGQSPHGLTPIGPRTTSHPPLVRNTNL
jgi:hypothetical protein